MIINWHKSKRPDETELEARIDEARVKLAQRQMKVKEGKVPVLVMLEGWGAAGKGSVLGKIIKNMDPRFFKVETIDKPSEEELRKPFLYKYFRRIPEAGRFTFLDGGWVDEVVYERLHGNMDDKDYRNKIDSIKRFERTLSDNGYLLMKFFLHIDKKEQKTRITNLLEDKNTSWRVSEEDQWQNKNYDIYQDAYDVYLNDTNQSYAPWYIIDGSEKKWAELQILEIMIQGIDTALMNNGNAVPILQNVFPLEPIPKLADVSLDVHMSE